MSNGNSSFTYVQNVNTVDVQEINAGSLSAASVVAGSVAVLPTYPSDPTGLVTGVSGQVLVDVTTTPATPVVYICTGGTVWAEL
jgi:hypothetical protein